MVRIARNNPILPAIVRSAALTARSFAHISGNASVKTAKVIIKGRFPAAPKTKFDGNCLDLYFNQIKHSKKLTQEDELLLANRIKEGDKAALNLLVEANLKFVVAVAKNYRNQGLTFGDLINEGNVGLIKAAQRFDGSAGCRFISYGVWWIRQGILVALAEQGRFLNISPGRVGFIRKIGKATQSLTQKLGRAPDQKELAGHLGYTPELVTECHVLAFPPKSLSGFSTEGAPSLEETLEDDRDEGTDRNTVIHMLEKNMAMVLDQLDTRTALVLRMSYGIGGGAVYTLKEISEKLDLSRERVRQIKAASIEILRHPAKRRLMGI